MIYGELVQRWRMRQVAGCHALRNPLAGLQGLALVAG